MKMANILQLTVMGTMQSINSEQIAHTKKSWGGPGQEPGKFRLVHDIRLDDRGRLWVTDRENKRVQIFTQDGELLAVIGGNLMRIGAVWISGSLAYIGELDGGITVVDMDFHVLAQLGCKGSVNMPMVLRQIRMETCLYLPIGKIPILFYD